MSALYAFIYNNLFTHKHLGVLENFFACVHVFQIELEFEKTLGARERTNNKLNP